MATRSTIGYVDPQTGYVCSVYCHWDGYLEHNGRILCEHYNTLDRVRALVNMGGISSLAPSIECPEGHSFDSPVDGHTVFYARDRGEPLRVSCSSIGSFEDFDNAYNYVFKDNKWYYDRGSLRRIDPVLNELQPAVDALVK